jgi:hypothetical protein
VLLLNHWFRNNSTAFAAHYHAVHWYAYAAALIAKHEKKYCTIAFLKFTKPLKPNYQFLISMGGGSDKYKEWFDKYKEGKFDKSDLKNLSEKDLDELITQGKKLGKIYRKEIRSLREFNASLYMTKFDRRINSAFKSCGIDINNLPKFEGLEAELEEVNEFMNEKLPNLLSSVFDKVGRSITRAFEGLGKELDDLDED